MARLKKWYQCMLVTWSNLMVYKVNFLLQMIAPLFVFLFVKVSLWTSIYEGAERIAGYDLDQMLSYHLWILIVTLITLSQAGGEISQDIRLGRITAYLIYPFSLFEFHLAKFLANILVKVIVALVTLAGAMAAVGVTVEPMHLVQGMILSLCAAGFWFMINYFFGLIAFWLEETWTFTVMIQVITYFFSGAIIPLELYPEWLKGILEYSPFPYIGFVPAKIFMGAEVDLGFSLLVLGVWTLIVALLSQWVWNRGVRMYTAAGM